MSNSFVNEVETNPFLCIICFKSFPEKLKLSLHTTSFHNAVMNHKTNKTGKQCSICSRTFHKNSLRRHIQSVHKLKTFSIPNNFDEESEPTNEIHIPVHERKEPPMPGFQCFICNASFTEKNNLNTHVAEVHERKTLNTKTTELNTNTNPNPEIKTEEGNLNMHIAEVHKQNNLDEKTLYFNAIINSNPEIKTEESNLNTHIAEVHERKTLDEKTLELNGRINPNPEIKTELETNFCKICNIEFLCSTDFAQHIDRVHEIQTVNEDVEDIIPKNEAILCEENGGFFVTNEIFESEKSENDYKTPASEDLAPDYNEQTPDSNEQIPEHKQICDGNDKTTENDDQLKGHIPSVHERKKPFQCNGCDYSFARNSHLKEHIASVHKRKKTFDDNEQTPDNDKQLKGHIPSVHERVKPFKCTDCDISFERIGSLLIHVASIHDGKNLEIQSQLSCDTVIHENQTSTRNTIKETSQKLKNEINHKDDLLQADLKLHRLSDAEISKWTTKSNFKKRTENLNS